MVGHSLAGNDPPSPYTGGTMNLPMVVVYSSNGSILQSFPLSSTYADANRGSMVRVDLPRYRAPDPAPEALLPRVKARDWKRAASLEALEPARLPSRAPRRLPRQRRAAPRPWAAALRRAGGR